MLHGAGGGAWECNVWARLFASRGWTVAAPDLQPVAAGLAATRLDDYRAQALAALVALPRPRVLVGASLGGLLALQCSAAAEALVLVNPLPPAPWHDTWLEAPHGDAIVPWRARASLAGTRRAMPDASDADSLFAFRRWRDESAAVLDEARRGVQVQRPACPTLVVASARDEDVPAATSRTLASAFSAALHELPEASHVGPLLGREAHAAAAAVVTWLNVKIA
jgi:pimeloyl-ACP methyl ester carboxylesterase